MLPADVFENIGRTVFCFAENDDPAERFIRKKIIKQINFRFQVRNTIYDLADAFRRFCFRSNVDDHRHVEKIICYRFYNG